MFPVFQKLKSIVQSNEIFTERGSVTNLIKAQINWLSRATRSITSFKPGINKLSLT